MEVSRGVAGAPRGSQEEGAREHGVPPSVSFFLSSRTLCEAESLRVAERELALLLSLLFVSPLFFQKKKMSFAMTANFFYAVVVAGLAYNVFILYAGASAVKLALSK